MSLPSDTELLGPSGAATRLPSLGSPELSTDYLARIKEILEALLGRRGGNDWDRVVTFRDLHALGLQGGAGGGGMVFNMAGAAEIDASSPGFQQFVGRVSAEIERSAAFRTLQRRIGSAEDMAHLPEEIKRQLQLRLEQVARERMADIQTVDAKIQTTALSMASRMTEITAALEKTAAGVRQFDTAYADRTQAIALQVTQLAAALEGVGSVELEERFEAIASEIDGLQGQWSIKIQTNDPANPIIAGIALAVEAPIAGAGTSSLIFMAEKFGFVTNNGNVMPFSIVGSQITFNGNVRINGQLVIGPTGLQPGFEAPGTKNSDLTASINSAQVAADAANLAISNITANGILDKSEKPEVIQKWAVISGGEASGLALNADALGVSRDAFWGTYVTLTSYLGGLSPAWNDTTQDTTIVRDTFNSNFANYYTAKQALLNAIAAKSATMADAYKIVGMTSFRALTTGASNVASVGTLGLFQNGTLLRSVQRGYSLSIIRRSDGVEVYYSWYDLVGGGALSSGRVASHLVADLNTIGPGYLAVVWAYDESRDGRTPELMTAMYRCGASRGVFGSPRFKYRAAYILVGIGGCGEGNGHEAYQGSVDSDANAWCDVSFSLVNGALTGVSGNYTPQSLLDIGYTGDTNATAGSPAGTRVGTSWAVDVDYWSQLGRDAFGAVPGINSAIADRLSKTGNEEISGQKSLISQYALLVGTVNDGIIYGSTGLYGRNSGFTKFSIGADGRAIFADQLIAAWGSFGAVSIAPGGKLTVGAASNFGDEGVFLGYVGNVAKFSIVTGTSKLLYDPSSGAPLQIINASIARPQFTIARTTSETYYTVGRTGTTNFASFPVAPSNGVGPYTYDVSVAGGTNGSGGGVRIVGTTGSTSSVALAALGSTISAPGVYDYYVTYRSIGADNRATTLTFTFTLEFT